MLLFVMLLAAKSSPAISVLIFYVLFALSFSFFCSICEAVLLSTSFSYVELLVEKKERVGKMMRGHKQNMEQGISAILTLNTIAHTVGAVGAGSQAAVIFGNKWIGLISAILTLLILVFSEIIPKTLGALYWKQLVPFTAYSLKILIWILYPIVWITHSISQLITFRSKNPTTSRAELEVLAKIGAREGILEDKEHVILRNLLFLSKVKVSDIMTPRTVIFMLQENVTVENVKDNSQVLTYSRIPVYGKSTDDVCGFVLRHQILSALAEDRDKVKLSELKRPIHSVPETVDVARVLEEFTKRHEHIFLVIDEYGGTAGIITLEDALESLLGTEITDETDLVVDLRELAKKRHSRKFGFEDSK